MYSRVVHPSRSHSRSHPRGRARLRATANVPSASQITALQSVRDYPAVSLLLTTTPGAVLSRSDAARLDALAASAVSRIREELQPAAAAPAVRRLYALVDKARRGVASKGLAIFAAASTGDIVRLPVAVRDRAVVDPTFATRDLVRALQRTPRHLVLALNGGQARLFDGLADTLLPAPTSAFPMYADQSGVRSPGRGDRPGRTSRSRAGDNEFYRQVDQALGTYARLHPAPLVIVGDERAVAGFRQVSTNCDRLAGVVRGNLLRSPLPELVDRIRETLDDYLHRREAEALAVVEQRADAGRVASGVPSAWLAARTQRPELLAVDETLFYPARISDDGDTLTPATDVEHPDVVDDVVDELIELVLLRGGWVALTSPGALDAHQGVALAVRR